MDQAALTVVVPIDGARLSALQAELASIEEQVRARTIYAAQGAAFPFGDLVTAHFARFVVIDPPAGDATAPALLVFATVYDGPLAQHLNELVTVAGEGLLRVLSRCDKRLEGQPQDALRAYLKTHAVFTDAFWVGHSGRSVGEIRAEAQLHAELTSALGRSSGRLSSDPLAEALACVRERPGLQWALAPGGPMRMAGYRKALAWTATVLCALVILGTLGVVIVPALVAWLLRIRVLERRDAREARRAQQHESVEGRKAEVEHKRQLAEDEGRTVQNQMTAVTDVKTGFVRFATLYVVLRVVDFLGRYYWDHGALHGIRTIHFARWFLVEQGRGRRLIFLSNYDGSWENYLGDFIDQAASGLTGIWSNTIGFPDAKWLILAGARRELKFKRWVRRCQIKTQVWYSAYPHLSVANVQNNSMIRRGLQGLPGLEARREWLRRV